MNISTKIKPLSAAMLLALGATGAEAVTFNFTSNTATGVNGVDFNYTCYTGDFTVGREFRMCDPTGKLGGGFPLQKDTVSGNEVWTFDDIDGAMIATTGSPNTAGIIPSYTAPYAGSSADPTGGGAMDDGALFFGASFSFLAPTQGSNAAAAYGVGQYTPTGATTFEIHFPVLEAQWGGVFFPLGQASGGITFYGTFDDGPIKDGSGSFSMWAEEEIDPSEDPNAAGFANWTPEWYYTGTIPDFVPVIANPPTSDVGTLVPTPPSLDGRISLQEAQAIGGVDSDMSVACIGGCFDYSVTGLTNGQTTQVTLPLTTSIPANAVYRKFDGSVWRDFDTNAGDTLESGSTATDPTDCSGVAWTPDLTEGDNCVRATMAEGGNNDQDSVGGTVQNGTLVDPGGVAVPLGKLPDNTIPGEELSSGCTLASGPVAANKRADWWLLAAFLGLLGLRRKLKLQRLD